MQTQAHPSLRHNYKQQVYPAYGVLLCYIFVHGTQSGLLNSLAPCYTYECSQKSDTPLVCTYVLYMATGSEWRNERENRTAFDN